MTPSRVVLMVALTIALLAAPLATVAQEGKVYRVGFLSIGFSPVTPTPYLETFRDGLRQRGYVDGHNVTVVYRWAEGKADRLAGLASELLRLKPDVIVTASTPATLAAMQATSTVPIVMTVSGDPLAAGIVTNLSRPGGNVTGFSTMATELTGKRLELLKEVVPGLRRLAVIWNPANTAMRVRIRELDAAARALSVVVHDLYVREPSHFDFAFSSMAQVRPDAVLVIADSFTFVHRTRLLEFMAAQKLPTMYELREFVDDGGLMMYGPSLVEMYRRAAVFVDKILKGAKPADLPVEQPTKFELVINVRTAKALGLTIPRSVLVRADEIID